MRGTAATLACFAAIAVLLAWSRWLARRRWASLCYIAMAAGCAATAAIAWALFTGLAGFSPLRQDAEVARIRFDAAGPGRFRATLLRLPQGEVQVLDLPGDEWRIEVDTLEWPAVLAATGLQPSYRLARLESRESAAATHRPAEPTRAYPLSAAAGFDLWNAARSSALWSRIATAAGATLPWQPMPRPGEYLVRLQARALHLEPAAGPGAVLSGSP